MSKLIFFPRTDQHEEQWDVVFSCVQVDVEQDGSSGDIKRLLLHLQKETLSVAVKLPNRLLLAVLPGYGVPFKRVNDPHIAEVGDSGVYASDFKKLERLIPGLTTMVELPPIQCVLTELLKGLRSKGMLYTMTHASVLSDEEEDSRLQVRRSRWNF